MLRLHPDKRAKASDLIHHNWLEGILVQGEIDVIRRLEMDEAAKRRGLEMEQQQQQQQQSSSSRVLSSLDQSERDAMKPVDESVIIVNGQEEEEDEEDEDEGSTRPRHYPPILGAPPAPMVMASGIARAFQSNTNMSPPKQASASRSAGSKKRT